MSYPPQPSASQPEDYPPYQGQPPYPGQAPVQPPAYPPYPPPGYPPYPSQGQLPYAPPPGYVPTLQPIQPSAQVQNPYGLQALAYGGGSLVLGIIAALLGYYLIGIVAIYAIYIGIRGLILGFRLPNYTGVWQSALGLVLALLSLVLTILVATNLIYL